MRQECRQRVWPTRLALSIGLLSVAAGCGPPAPNGDNDGGQNRPPALYIWEYDRRVTTIDGEPVLLTLRAKDAEGEHLTFEFGAEAGGLNPLDTEAEGEGVWVSRAIWSPTGLETGHNYDLWCRVSDTSGNTRQGDTQAIVLTTGHILMGDPVLESQSRKLSPTQLDFGTEQSELTAELTIEALEEDGAEYLPWQVGRKPDWISEVSPGYGDQSETISVSIDRTAMGPGRYTGDVRFDFVAPDQVLSSYLSAEAEVSGGSGALLGVNPTSLDFGTGGTSLTFAVSNDGAGTLTWSCTPSDGWISISDHAGTNGAAVTVTVDRSGLSEGTHTGSVAITSDGGDSLVAISLSVAAPGTPTATLEATPTNGLAPLTVTFNGSASDTDGTIVLCSLDFGDGSAPWSDSSPPAGLQHTYASAGVHAARLVVVDDDGNQSTSAAPVTVTVCSDSVSVLITHVPPFGVWGDPLEGRVCNATSGEYSIAVCIFTGPGGGWWTKPTLDAPLTTIDEDGVFVCNVTTGGLDENATRFAAYVVPNAYTPPAMYGSCSLPQELEDTAVAKAVVTRPDPSDRTVQFAGYDWTVKASSEPVGPGPNYFDDTEESVFVDGEGHLHLRIADRGGEWRCSEVVANASLGYGTYMFTLDTALEDLDENTVVGLFTWEDCVPEYHYREIDVEFSRWGDPAAENAQFIVQPGDAASNRHRFFLDTQDGASAHSFDWREDRVSFSSALGSDPTPDYPGLSVGSWTYAGSDIPPAGNENPRISFWLLNGSPPANGQGAEVIIRAFDFVPAG